MKNKRFLNLMALGLLAFPLCFCSCEDKLTEDPHYERPGWLVGSAYELLQSEGNYSSFLKAIDLTGYKAIVNGQSLLTVMAPDDDAFDLYLKDKGYESVDAMYEIAPTELEKLVSFHLLYYAYDWKKLVNFRPVEGDGATENQLINKAGMYFKHRTRSSEPSSTAIDPATGREIKVYHFDRLLPVFSNKMFETMQLDAKYNYEYFYRNSTWTGGSKGDNGGFNVSNASVLDNVSVPTDNGYLYHIDQVLEPLESIYAVMSQNPEEYSTYQKLYDIYTSYIYDAEVSNNYGKGDSLFLRYHTPMADIALEWYSSFVENYSINTRYGYSLFVPNNQAIDAFFKEFWGDSSYETIFDLDPIIVKYFLLQTFANSIDPVFPEMIKNNMVYNELGTLITVDPDEVSDPRVCTNGFFYGMNQMEAPALFSSVMGAAFTDAAYLPFLYALDGSGIATSFANKNSSFAVLLPDTAKFSKLTMQVLTLDKTTGPELVKFDDLASAYVSVSQSEKRNILNLHVAPDVTEIPQEGSHVIETVVPFNYWFIRDGKVTTNTMFNQCLHETFSGEPIDLFVPVEAVYTGNNGTAYVYGGEDLFQEGDANTLLYELAVCNDENRPYYYFARLLQESELLSVNEDGQVVCYIPIDDRFISFIPTNEAILNAAERLNDKVGKATISEGKVKISGSSNKTKYANYLRSYFALSSLNVFTSYPYPGSGVNGELKTDFGDYNMNLLDDGATLKVEFINGENTVPANVIDKYFYLPFVYSDGCFHFIDDVLL